VCRKQAGKSELNQRRLQGKGKRGFAPGKAKEQKEGMKEAQRREVVTKIRRAVLTYIQPRGHRTNP